MKTICRLAALTILIALAAKCGEVATEKMHSLTRGHVQHIDRTTHQ
jgi:hypothetical protein